jgi:hypothetical protein
MGGESCARGMAVRFEHRDYALIGPAACSPVCEFAARPMNARSTRRPLIMIDYPGLNSAWRHARRRGSSLISPRCRAWENGVQDSAGSRAMAVVPFEEEYFRRFGVRAEASVIRSWSI